VEAAIPYGDVEVPGVHGQCAGEMNCVGAPKAVLLREVAGVAFDDRRELDRTDGGPVVLPGTLSPSGAGR